ncbi:MAG: GntP family permease [Tannerella sp.]|jgi:Gnt-I system low-affinity gluconate transporter|nr:GntP family permease [Tannerella sp.]
MSLLPLCILAFSIVLLLFMVLKLKIHAFLSLLIVSVFLGMATGMPMNAILESMTEGMSSTLGFVATVVGIGAIFGQVLESSGGAESLARSLVTKFGKEKAPYSLAAAGFLVAIPVFLDVGFIILAPVLYALAKDTKKSLLFYAIPLLAGLAVTHAFIPPTPGPVAVAEILQVDLGWLIFFGAVIGIPVTLVAGPLFGRYIGNRMYVKTPDFFKEEDPLRETTRLPSFWQVTGMIIIPLALIVANTVTGVWAKAHGMTDTFPVHLITFLGHPFIALLIATLVAIYTLGIRRGFTRTAILELSSKALNPAGLIILVTGAGGVFKQLLVDSGIGVALAESMSGSALPPLVLAYLLALIIRVTQGSATVAMITSAGIMAPLLSACLLSEPHKALIVIAIASGATTLSHVNDSGFWLVGKYLGMNEKQTLRSWTVMETIISITGFTLAFGLSFFF